jgi:hypothetical protein
VLSWEEEVGKMSELRDSDIFASLSSAWETAINEKRQRDVILSGLAAYHLFHEKNDSARESATLLYVRQAIDDLLKDRFGERQIPSAQRACSFCACSEPEVRLAAGANVFICDVCVSTLSEVFKQEATE